MGLLDRLGRRTRPAAEPPKQEPASYVHISGLEQAALTELNGFLDGTAVCKVPADLAVRTKELEGRTAAFADIRRALAAQPDAQITDIVVGLRERWEHGPAGPLWQAYRRGGAAALDEAVGITDQPKAAEPS